jgi:hypothetical protein
MLHGTLYCGAFRAHFDPSLPLADAYCRGSCCNHEPETLSHLFVTCPEVSPAVDWLARLWHRLTGHQPPTTPRCVVADDQHTGKIHLAELWTLFRLALLRAIWGRRQARRIQGSEVGASGEAPLAAATAVVASTIATVTQCIKRDWVRATKDPRRETIACPSWFRGRNPLLKLPDFVARWVTPGGGALCSVQAATGTLTVHLGLHHPVPGPTAGAAAAEGEGAAAAAAAAAAVEVEMAAGAAVAGRRAETDATAQVRSPGEGEVEAGEAEGEAAAAAAAAAAAGAPEAAAAAAEPAAAEAVAEDPVLDEAAAYAVWETLLQEERRPRELARLRADRDSGVAVDVFARWAIAALGITHIFRGEEELRLDIYEMYRPHLLTALEAALDARDWYFRCQAGQHYLWE